MTTERVADGLVPGDPHQAGQAEEEQIEAVAEAEQSDSHGRASE